MTSIKVKPINYYRAIAWCMTNAKSKWSSDPTNHAISFLDTKDALIFSMKFQ